MAWLRLKHELDASFAAVDAAQLQQSAPVAAASSSAIRLVERMTKAASMLDDEKRGALQCYVRREIMKQSPDLSSTITADVCEVCGVQMMVIANDSMLACARCATTRVITSANAWHASMDADFTNVNAHPKSRLLEWLEFAQAKEYTEVPADVLERVMKEIVMEKASGLEQYAGVIRQERLANGPYVDAPSAIERLRGAVPNIEALLKAVDSVAIRNLLRNCPSDLKKVSERSAKVSSLLSGFWPERLTADQEEYIRKLFMAAHPVYERYRKSQQPSWPGGYAYFLRCLLVLLGWDEFAAMFPIQLTAKNAEREDMRAEIWGKLRWQLVPSVAPLSPMKLPDGSVSRGEVIAAADAKCKCVARGYDDA